MTFYVGIVENRDDPLKLGRCQVRIIGLHTHDKGVLPTSDLPWAYPLQPINSASISGIGLSPTGLVEGTTVIVLFADEPDNQQPIILGSMGGIPQDNNTIIFGRDIDDRPILKNLETGEQTPLPASEQETDDVVSAEPPAIQETPTSEIPTTPPDNWTGNRKKAETGIKALLSACDKLGMTTREQKASVLAIVGGECGWIPQQEGYNYSAEALQRVFSKTFGDNTELANQYARWKGTRESFFKFVYAPENNGSLVGNIAPNDGERYFGRGFIQLTGRPNYTKYAELSGVDILTKPELLNDDIELSAMVAVSFIKNVAKGAQPIDHPGYFYAAKRGVNPNDPIQTKLEYYEYFYGVTTPQSAFQNRDAGAIPANPVDLLDNEELLPGPQGFISIGFKDPNGKYPLKEFIFEPDTNRLARGITLGTIVPIKDANRAIAIPIANQSRTFDQPKSSFGARYPFNHVRETESGHVQEFDDTPGKERLLTYHRKGTFTEIDENGTEIHHIVGDNYTIVDRNGCIYITGECNLTTRGNINILCQSDANVQVEGDTKMSFGGNLDIGVAKDFKLSVGGNFLTKTTGKIGMDGNRIDFNSGTTGSVSNPPSRGEPIRKQLEYLTTTSSSLDKIIYELETEEEWATPDGQAAKKLLESQYPIDDITAIDEAVPTGGSNQIVPSSCDVIFNTQEFTSDFRLSQNFTLGMFFDGGFNKRHKLVDQGGLTKQQIVCNLSQLAQNILEPALSLLPGGIGGFGSQWKINSGYRQGSSKSQHNKGQAVDIGLSHNTPNRKQTTFNLAKDLEKTLTYDQMILEYRGTTENWIHLSYSEQSRRKQAFTMVNDSTYPQSGSTGFILV